MPFSRGLPYVSSKMYYRYGQHLFLFAKLNRLSFLQVISNWKAEKAYCIPLIFNWRKLWFWAVWKGCEGLTDFWCVYNCSWFGSSPLTDLEIHLGQARCIHPVTVFVLHQQTVLIVSTIWLSRLESGVVNVISRTLPDPVSFSHQIVTSEPNRSVLWLKNK